MFAHLTPVQIAAAFSLFLAGGLNAYLGWRTLRKPRRPEGRTLGYIFITLTWWALFYGLHIIMPTRDSQYAFNILKYLGAVFVPALWLVFCAQYTQQWEKISPRTRRLLLLPPFLALAVVLTDPLLHGWWGGHPQPYLESTSYLGYTFEVLKGGHTLLYYLHVFVSYVYVLGGIVLLSRFQRMASPIYRSQIREMSLAILLPTLANLVTQVKSPFPWGLDTFLFTVTAGFMGWAIFRHRLLELIPIARRTVLEQIPEGVITLDEKDTILDINQSACDLLQVSSQDLIGRALTSTLPVTPLLSNAIWDMLKHPAGEQFSQEIHLSTQRTYLLHATPLHYSGHVVGRIMLLQDISEQINARKQIEILYEQAEQERQRLHVTLQNASDGILLLDDDGVVISGNPAAKSLLPYDSIIQFPEPLKKGWDKVHAAGQAAHLELVIEQQTFHIGISPVPKFGTVVTLHDITPLTEVLRLNNELISILSHDLRAPLSSISGYAQLAQMDNLSRQEYMQIFQRIDSSARRLANFASDILTISRLESGIETDTQDTPVLMNKIAQYIAQDMEGAARAKGLIFRIDAQPHPPFYGETHLIEQMWRNLIDNAIKYTEAGFISISITTEDNEIVAQITDTGRGIAPEDLPHIFEKFYRPQQNSPHGVGLGLSLVKNIVEKHHGSITVTSTPGQGTTFTMRFPL
ncbi:MAG: PAS domain-containing protein [Calditrichaeota bacterium]|nr:MAG: PAS domain-containing protein [Calditrichota bacterium]